MPSKLTQLKWIGIIAFVVGFVGLSEIYGNWEMFFMLMFVFGYGQTDKIIDMEREIKSLEDHQKLASDTLDSMRKLMEEKPDVPENI